MDIQIRTKRQKLSRRLFFSVLAFTAFVCLLGAAVWMGQRPPAVDSDQIWTDTVNRGAFVDQITASGRLITPEVRAIANQAEGIVEQINVLPGDRVSPHDVLIVMNAPQLERDLAAARWELSGAKAEQRLEQVKAENERLDLVASTASAESDYVGARLELEAQEQLGEGQVFSALEVERTRLNVAQLKKRLEAEQARLERYTEVRSATQQVAEAQLASLEDKVLRLSDQLASLQVKAGFSGVVQEINVEPGERLNAGHAVARIVNPDYLIARVRVPERSANRVQYALPVTMELGPQQISGSVARIDPSVRDRMVDVDIAIDPSHSAVLRPDLSVTARIELDRRENVLLLNRPVHVDDDADRIHLFRLNPHADQAERIEVRIGRKSNQQIEILSGLEAGDRAILNDLAEWRDQPRLRIR